MRRWYQPPVRRVLFAKPSLFDLSHPPGGWWLSKRVAIPAAFIRLAAPPRTNCDIAGSTQSCGPGIAVNTTRPMGRCDDGQNGADRPAIDLRGGARLSRYRARAVASFEAGPAANELTAFTQ